MMLEDHEIRVPREGEKERWFEAVGREDRNQQLSMPGDTQIDLEEKVHQTVTLQVPDMPFHVGTQVIAGPQRPEKGLRSFPGNLRG
jgi:hypothetical protein